MGIGLNAQSQAYIWGESLPGSTFQDEVFDIAIDSDNSSYITGKFQGTLELDPVGSTSTQTSSGSNNIFVAKYDDLGAYQWGFRLGGTSSLDIGKGVEVDNAGNVYFVGQFDGTTDFNPLGAPNVVSSTTNSTSDVFIAKYTPAGQLIWVKLIGGAWSFMSPNDFVIKNNHLHIGGRYTNNPDFDPGPGTANAGGASGSDMFVAKYDLDGNYVWHVTAGGTQTDAIGALAVDDNGDVIAGGSFHSSCDFDPSGGSSILTAQNANTNLFVWKLSSTGAFVWVHHIVDDGVEHQIEALVTNSNNEIYVGGHFDGIADFDYSGSGDAHVSEGSNDILFSKFDANGNYMWGYSVGSSSRDKIYDIELDNNEFPVIVGHFIDTLDFDFGPDSLKLFSPSAVSVVVAKYNPNAKPLWAVQMGISSWNEGRAIALDTDNDFYLTGNFSSTIDLDPTSGVANHTSIFGQEIFFGKYYRCMDMTYPFNVTACDSYTWIDGNTYTTSNNTATHTLTSVAGCDSVLALNLTINNSNTGTDVQTACNSYTWIDGNTYTSSNNSATFTLTNAAGCDSLVTLDLIINNSNTGTDVQTACDSYTWIDGNTYTASNNSATFTLTNAAGCDSVVTLDLTMNNSSTGTDIQTTCDSYTWIDGNTYTTSNNTATHTLTNAVGCDSVVTLDLTILNSSTGTDVQTACDSYTWIDGNTYTASNNTATFTLTNAAGCDSVVTLDLTINNSTTGTDVQTACDSYTWIDGNTYTASNNTATHTLTNAAGCDSVVTLDLTINNSNTGTDVQTACDSYTWIDGNTYTASNNTATFTLTNTVGCDSLVTLDLTILNSSTGTDVQTACDSYTWIDGNTYTTSNNSATFTLTNAEGCDSIVTLDLTINIVDISVLNTSLTLTANETGASYQWLDCDNNYAAISGETNQEFTATVNGSYAVEVTVNNCTDTSACQIISDVSINEETKASIVVYPNPTNGLIQIESASSITEVKIFNLQGALVYETNKSTLHLEGLNDGLYLIRVTTQNGSFERKIIKK